MSKTFLKIKIMSLAAEARIIRAEERKWPRERDIPKDQREEPLQQARWRTREQLAAHRKFDVRTEARSALLAYGFLRGRAYRQIEQSCYEDPNSNRITELVCKFGGRSPKDKAEIFRQVREWQKQEPMAKAA